MCTINQYTTTQIYTLPINIKNGKDGLPGVINISKMRWKIQRNMTIYKILNNIRNRKYK